MKILLMEDDPVLAEIVVTYFGEDYSIVHASDAQQAQEYIDDDGFDLFIFDVNVPGKSGIELLNELRSFNNTTPAIIITSYGDIKHLKASFDAGAHDYIRKPFELEELKLRIEKSRTLFHIKQDSPIDISEVLTYYPSRHLVKDSDKETKLRPKEAELLNYFIANPKRFISQDELVQNIWDFDTLPSDATIRSYIRKLREVIGGEKITTQRGKGYRYK